MTINMTFRQAVLAGAAAGALLAPSVGHASAYAVGSMDVTNFVVDTPAFSSFFFDTQSSQTVLNGGSALVFGQHTSTASGGLSTSGSPVISSTNPGSLDIGLNCQGGAVCGGTLTNNSFVTPTGAPNPNSALGTYAAVDGHMLNTVIQGTSAAGHFGIMAVAQADPAGNAKAQSLAAMQMKWQFSVAETTTLHFSWSELISAAAQITDNFFGSLAQSSLNFTLKTTGSTCVTTAGSFGAHDTLTDTAGSCVDTAQAQNIAAVSNNASSDPNPIGGGLQQNQFHFFSVTIGAGVHELDFDFAAAANAIDSSPVAEPMSLGLLGTGLLGLGGLIYRRRREQNAA
jgi:hypothetical protein